MSREKMIHVENGISVPQQRQLLEVTQGLARALTEEEFITIIAFYNTVIDRLLSKEGESNE